MLADAQQEVTETIYQQVDTYLIGWYVFDYDRRDAAWSPGGYVH